jgi:hypothetical protein
MPSNLSLDCPCINSKKSTQQGNKSALADLGSMLSKPTLTWSELTWTLLLVLLHAQFIHLFRAKPFIIHKDGSLQPSRYCAMTALFEPYKPSTEIRCQILFTDAHQFSQGIALKMIFYVMKPINESIREKFKLGRR